MDQHEDRRGRRGPKVDSTRVRELRSQRRLRQLDVATTAGLNKHHFARIERGEVPWPALETTMKIADALGVEYGELLVSE
jgi:transcriptional regulator with XRE-family HTH domain